MNTPLVQCGASIYGTTGMYRSIPCPNKAKYGDYCGVHSPERMLARAEKAAGTHKPSRSEMLEMRNVHEKKRAKLMGEVITEAREAAKSHFFPYLKKAIDELDDFDGGRS